MGRKMIVLWTAVWSVAALLAVTAPAVMHLRERQYREQSAEEVRQAMEDLSPETAAMQYSLARWYNRNLTLEEPEPGYQLSYEGILNLGQGRMGLLEIPELELELPITHGINGLTGHDPATALPVGGQGNHTVLYLKDDLPMKEGMTVHTTLPGAKRCFRVDSVQVMPAQWPTDSPSPGEMLILVHDGELRRTIVRCLPGMEREAAAEDPRETMKLATAFAAAVSVLAAMARILDGLRERLRRKRHPKEPDFF